MSAPWSLKQVSQHASSRSCWVILQNQVYDVTDFLQEHPGGASVILKNAGKDCTEVYEPIHPEDALAKYLPPSKHLGPIALEAASTLMSERAVNSLTLDERRVQDAQQRKPPLSRIISLPEMELVARTVLSHKALSYYSSASDDEITTNENANAFSRFFFHPRVLRKGSVCSPQTTILGIPSAIPVFISGAALAKLGHPQGEVNLTRAAAHTSIIQMVSSNASMSAADIANAKAPGQPLFFQLYKHKDNTIAEKRVKEVVELGYNAIFLTVDAFIPGNRERDLRAEWDLEKIEGATPIYNTTSNELEVETLTQGGTIGNMLVNDDVDMTWSETIPWLRSVTTLPIVLKGIQCVADAVLAAEAGVDGILLSNHGGRQLEYSLPPLEVLYRIRKERPDLFDKLEVYADGGITRGTDVVKALCLGARAVGLGRPFLYAQSAYGAVGAVKIVRILEREIVTAMQLLGASKVSELLPEMVERVDWTVMSKL